MKVIVVRQPWAWLISKGHKRIENRTWSTTHRGPLLIQASVHRTSKAEFLQVEEFARRRGVIIPSWNDYHQGAVIAHVNLYNCATASQDPWFEGPFGFLLRDPIELLPITARGQLSIFDAPPEIVHQVRRQMSATCKNERGSF